MAELSSADINNLPDSDFAYIEPGGSKDSEGKTTPRSLRHFPIHDAAHVRNALARASQSPFGDKAMPKIKAAAKRFGVDVGEEQQETGRALLPESLADRCVRASFPGPELKVVEGGKMPTLVGRLATYNEWGHVKSRLEGEFVERMSPGAFTKTLGEHRAQIRVLFQHGEHPTVGMFPLGTIEDLNETRAGVDYAVKMFDTDYNRELLPALEAGQFGSSYTFRAPKDKRSIEYRPKRSDYNPEGLPEVTVQEVRMFEFGPCMFPVYAGTSAGVRSMTDEFVFARLGADPQRLRELLTTVPDAPILPAATEALSTEPSRGNPLATGQSRNVQLSVPVRKFHTSEDFVEWLSSKT